MGCDIHLHIELKHKDGRWLHYAAPSVDRWYDLFAVMANVRNRGAIEPISGAKGFPEDASEITKAIWESWGEHTPSWLSSSEVLKLEEWLSEEQKRADKRSLEAGNTPKFMSCDLEFSILHTYLAGNSFCAFMKYDDCDYIPKPFVDFRFVFWFDS